MIAIPEPFVTKKLHFTAKNQFFKAIARFTPFIRRSWFVRRGWFIRRSWWGAVQAFAQIREKEVTNLVKDCDDQMELSYSVGIEDATVFIFSRI